jgi:hypothetical protein
MLKEFDPLLTPVYRCLAGERADWSSLSASTQQDGSSFFLAV